MRKKKKINTAEYWQERHNETSLRTVGFIGLGFPFNRWMYKVRKVVFLRLLKNQNINLKNAKILDIGSGSGFYLELYQGLKAKDITASDFSSNALDQIKADFKNIKILKLDITNPITSNLKGKYDFISAFDILYHIVDDKEYSQAITNVSNLLKPGGIFAFSENLLQKKTDRASFQVSRSKKEIFNLLEKNKLKLIKVTPVFYLMNSPVDSKNLFLKMHWFLLENLLIRFNFLGNILAPLYYPLELFLVRFSERGPSTKIVLVKKVI